MKTVCVYAPLVGGTLRLPPDYLPALRRAGGAPVVVSSAREAAHLSRRLGGLVLIGGDDVAPALYGAPRHPRTVLDAPGRDADELALYAAFRAAEKPVLGICRGIQLINVAEGGTLAQHLPDLPFVACRHSGATVRHEALLAPGTALARAFSAERILVNSRHHQAVERVAPGLSCVATDPFGLPEAIASPDGLVLGVQWHPENLCPLMRPLFVHFLSLVRA